MKWESKNYLQNQEGKTRIVRKFLIFPRCLNSKHWRWLERARILERIVKMDIGGSCEWGHYKWAWVEECFVDQWGNIEDTHIVPEPVGPPPKEE